MGAGGKGGVGVGLGGVMGVLIVKFLLYLGAGDLPR